MKRKDCCKIGQQDFNWDMPVRKSISYAKLATL